MSIDLRGLVRVALTNKRFRHGDSGLEEIELPVKSPVVTALRRCAFPGGTLTTSAHPAGCSESWVAYLARCVRHRRRRHQSRRASTTACLWRRAASCWHAEKISQWTKMRASLISTICTADAMSGVIPVRSVPAGSHHRLALTLAGQVYSWGRDPVYYRLNWPAPVKGLETCEALLRLVLTGTP
jgi:hypothetical protein